MLSARSNSFTAKDAKEAAKDAKQTTQLTNTPPTAKNCGVEAASSGTLRGYIFIDLRRRCEHARKHL
jgi:hypothetical protein